MTTISVGQALLILIDKKKTEDLYLIKKLYLMGPADQKEMELLDQLLKDSLLSPYTVSKDHHVIDKNPTRRYFETHLAYETLLLQLKSLNIKKLENVINSCLALAEKADVEKQCENSINFMFNAVFKKNHYHGSESAYEFSEASKLVNTHEHFKVFSAEDQLKLIYLLKIAYLGPEMLALHLPLREAYHSTEADNYFLEPRTKNLGRFTKLSVSDTYHFGLLKSFMPVPLNDIAYGGRLFSNKPSDRYLYNPNAKWPADNFKKLVHPYGGSISGTLVSICRTLYYLHDHKKMDFTSKTEMASFFHCLIAILIYCSGGHTLNEYYSVLKISHIQAAFGKLIDGFKDISMQELLAKDNEKAFDLALKKTLCYHRVLLAKSNLHEDIEEKSKLHLSVRLR